MSQDTARERPGNTLVPATLSRSDWVDRINGALLDPGNSHLDDGVAVFDAIQPDLDRLNAELSRTRDTVVSCDRVLRRVTAALSSRIGEPGIDGPGHLAELAADELGRLTAERDEARAAERERTAELAEKAYQRATLGARLNGAIAERDRRIANALGTCAVLEMLGRDADNHRLIDIAGAVRAALTGGSDE
jgi:hypothetical protein